MNKLILASGSPRRRELLSELGYRYQAVVGDFDESTVSLEDPAKGVCELALGKARAAKEKLEKDPDLSAKVLPHGETPVYLGSDTVVVLDGTPMGKPADEAEAARMLRALSGRAHSVFTGVAVASEEESECFFSETKVHFYELSEELIQGYLASGEPMDKAGAYGIQGLGRVLIRAIEGDYFTVVGLPVAETYRLLKKVGISSRFLSENGSCAEVGTGV